MRFPPIRPIWLVLIITLAFGSIPLHAQDERATVAIGTSGLSLPDPATLASGDLEGRDLAENLFVGLFRYDAATRSAIPVLAREWTVSGDGLVWTFALRDDIRWVRQNNGAVESLRPVIARDFVAALQQACHPSRPSPPPGTLAVIAGCYAASRLDPVMVSEDLVAHLVGASAPDDATLILELAFPAAYLPSLLTGPEFRPIPTEFIPWDENWFRQIANGPYVVTGEDLTGVTLTRNPSWPDPLAGNVEQIEVAFFGGDGAAQAGAFEAGEVDFARLSPSNGADLASRLPDQVLVERGDPVWLLGFSTERRFVNEVGVRQALAWALNREALLATLPNVYAVPVTTLTSPGLIAGPPADTGVGFEPEAARAIFEAAGHANCANVHEGVDIALPEDFAPLGGALVAVWAETLGCGPELFAVNTLSDEALGNIAAYPFEEDAQRPHIWLAPWTATYMDAQSGAADAFHCQFGMLSGGMTPDCAPIDALIDLAAATLSAEERPAIYARLEDRYFGRGGLYPAVPLFATARYTGVADGLSGAQDFGPAWWGDWERQF